MKKPLNIDKFKILDYPQIMTFAQYLSRRKYLFIPVIIILAVMTAANLMLGSVKKNSLNRLKTSILETFEKQDFRMKSSKIRLQLEEIYEIARTISLMPGIRKIKGGNRKAESEDITGRGFNEDTRLSIQQLYNNLEEKVNISEIYGVVKTFDYQNGDIPLFMFDELIITSQLRNQAESQEINAEDIPEEYELAEYEVISEQIQYFQTNYPVFNYEKMKSIPILGSKRIRTCDNTQYRSKSAGNPVNAEGMCLSVPFYNTDGKFNGVITVILRINILEALLLDLPVVPVSKEDFETLDSKGLSIPPTPLHWLLELNGTGVSVYDRRNTELSNTILEKEKIKSSDILIKNIPIHPEMTWTLKYELNYHDFQERIKERKIFYAVMFLLLNMILIFILLIYFFNRYQRFKSTSILKNVSEVMRSITEGDLTGNISLKGFKSNTLNELIRHFSQLIKSLNLFITEIRRVSEKSTEYGQNLMASQEQSTTTLEEISASMMMIEERTFQLSQEINQVSVIKESINESAEVVYYNINQQSETLTRTTASIEEVISKVNNLDQKATEKLAGFGQITELLKSGSKEMKSTVAFISSVSEETKGIIELLNMIKRVSSETNLLAMNAAIEAAHAGEFGKGFSVVAEEIRQLSETTADNSSMIEKNLKQVIGKITAAADQTHKTEMNISHIFAYIGLINESFNEMIHELNSIASHTKDMLMQINELVAVSMEVTDSSVNLKTRVEEIENSMANLIRIAHENSQSIREITTGINEIVKEVNDISDMTEINALNVRKLTEEISRYKTETTNPEIPQK